MADMNCLNNEDELVSQLDSQSQIDSELDSVAELYGDMEKVVEVTHSFTGLETEDIVVSVDNENNTISAELQQSVKDTISNNTSAVERLSTEKADKTEIPTKVTDLSNDANFIDNTVNNLVNYYTKNESYTKTEILELVSQIPRFTVQIVSTLPITNISTTTIYLLAVTDSSANNYYEEYIFANGQWELLGTTKISLDNYYTKTEVEQTIQNALSNLNLQDYYTKTEVDNAIQESIDNIDFPQGSAYFAGEGLSLDNANTFSVNPAQQEKFGGIKIWVDENGYLCITTKRPTEVTVQEQQILTITETGSEIIQQNRTLTIGG